MNKQLTSLVLVAWIAGAGANALAKPPAPQTKTSTASTTGAAQGPSPTQAARALSAKGREQRAADAKTAARANAAAEKKRQEILRKRNAPAVAAPVATTPVPSQEELEFGTGDETWDREGTSEGGGQPVAQGSPPTRPRLAAMTQWFPVVNLLIVVLLIVGGLITKSGIERRLGMLGQKTTDLEKESVRSDKSLRDPGGVIGRVRVLEKDRDRLTDEIAQLRRGVSGTVPNATRRDRQQEEEDQDPRIPITDYGNAAAAQTSAPARGAAPVTEYLTRAQQSDLGIVRLQTDSVDDHVFTAAADGFYFLVRGRGGTDYAIPYHDRFTTKQLFDTYYTSAYECRVPGAGDVWVVRPASLRRQGDMWRLDERGEIEVRA